MAACIVVLSPLQDLEHAETPYVVKLHRWAADSDTNDLGHFGGSFVPPKCSL